MSKVIKGQPQILTFTIEDGIEPKLECLQQCLQLNATSSGKLIQKCAAILACSISKNMEPKVDWLQQRLVLNNEQLLKMVWRRPTLFHYSIPDTMEPTLLWLQDCLSLSNNGLSCVLTVHPPMFGYNVTTNLVPTFEFYEQCVGTKGAQSLLVSYPSPFGASLEKWLKPRLEEATKLGFKVDSGLLQQIATYTEDQWCRSFDKQREKKGVIL